MRVNAQSKPVIEQLAADRLGGQASRVREWLLQYPRAIPALVFAAIAAITILGVYAIENNAEQRARIEAREYAQAIATGLEQRGNNFSAYLRAGAALFSTIEEVNSQTFRQFVTELGVEQTYRGSEGLGWSVPSKNLLIGRKSPRSNDFYIRSQ